MSNFVWFEIPTNNVEKSKEFYSALFGWEISKLPGPMDYEAIKTSKGQEDPVGGFIPQKESYTGFLNYVGVDSIDETLSKLESLGGKVLQPKTEVPSYGFFAIVQDLEGNSFALWQKSDNPACD